jgi:hypothetical protein
MGFKERTKGNFVKMKNGKFYASTDKECTTPYDELEGVLTEISIREDEYEGNKIEKVYLTLNDGVEDYILPINLDTSYTSSLIGFLKNADLTEPLSLVPTMRQEGDVTKKGILVRQNGKWLKAYYTKDTPNGQPKIEPVMVKGKQLIQNGRGVWDKAEFLDFFRNVITNEIAPQLGGGGGGATGQDYNPTKPKATTAKAETADVINGSEPDHEDDLPF